jgi:leucyl-tRNA synthetase
MASNKWVKLQFKPSVLDRKWQSRWDNDHLYKLNNDDPRPKWYELTMFPYPSGDLHIGHWYVMAPSDTRARYMRMKGYNVLHPIGFDGFGLPAENAAIKRGIHPKEWTMANIERMRKQLRSIGAIYDWDKEVVTCDPSYYRWNQWFFLQLLKRGLAYRATAPVNWCPGCNTVLANEQVLNGRCERSDDLVERKEMAQWFFRITNYADELLDFSNVIDWPERIKSMQTNWIGRSEGVEVSFDISHYGLEQKDITTFTTRIDTIFGVTFLALAPEHRLVPELTSADRQSEVEAYIQKSRRATEVERLSEEREKTGVFTGAHAVNRLNGEHIPILIADYVLSTYGTGAVMGVPAHDQRDLEFAQKYGMEIRIVIAPKKWAPGEPLELAYAERDGVQVNSGRFSGLPSTEGYLAIIKEIESNGWGKSTVTYRMRDWLISRQRYWGTPIPIVYCNSCGAQPVPEDQLPVLLPDDAEFLPTGESPLRLHAKFLNAHCPACGKPATRETDTMDTFVDSAWYFLRYLNPHYHKGPFDPTLLKQWAPVHQYTGGAEHAVMHLLYARFFTKVLRDLKLLEFKEPFLRLFNQGTILADHMKMSKSRGNVVAPDDYVATFGADVVRLYLMFIGPWEGGGNWTDTGINGIARWINRVWDLCLTNTAALLPSAKSSNKEITRLIHLTIRRVVTDIERFKFNTAISALMEFTNALSKIRESGGLSRETWEDAVRNLLLLLAPMAPHIAEELWERTGESYSVHTQMLPKWEEALTASDDVILVVQVNGKVRDRIAIPINTSEEETKHIALGSERVLPYTTLNKILKVIYVPSRWLVNIVVKG